LKCIHCHTELPDHARFCLQCGAPQPEGQGAVGADTQPMIDLEGNVSKQLTEAFFRLMRQKVEEEQPGAAVAAYRELL
jgi:hypothetical protein